MKQLMLNRLSKNGINGTARFVQNHVLQTSGNLIGYGCWCAFDADANNIGEAFGKPLDKWDEFCHDLYQGYMCAVMDAAERNELCEPWNTNYQVSGVGNTGVPIACAMAAGGDLCAEAACIVETTFANNAFAMVAENGIGDDEDH